jgi:hypothetical protein
MHHQVVQKLAVTFNDSKFLWKSREGKLIEAAEANGFKNKDVEIWIGAERWHGL